MKFCVAALFMFGVAYTADVNESVLSAINERRIFLGQPPVVWPNTTIGQVPGVYPQDGFYDAESVAFGNSLLATAITHANDLRGNFVCFIGGQMPNGIPAPLNTTQPPFDLTAATRPIATWSDLVAVLQASAFVSWSINIEEQTRWISGYDAGIVPPAAHLLTNQQAVEIMWEALEAVPYTQGSVNMDWGAASGYGGALFLFGSDGMRYWDLGSASQNRARLSVGSSGVAIGKSVVVFLRGFPAEGFVQNKPALVPADGGYHKFNEMILPSVGDWITGEIPTVFPVLLGNQWVTTAEQSVDKAAGIRRDGPIGYIDCGFVYPTETDPQDKPETPCDSDCPTSSAGSGASDQPASDSTSPGSLIDNIRLTYRHWADDYRCADDPAGCRSCSSGGGASGDKLPALHVRRVHRYDLIGQPSSCGPGVFLDHDITLSVNVDGHVDIVDPQSTVPVRMKLNAADGSWLNPTHNLSKGFSVQGGGGLAAGKTVIYQTRSGSTFTFECIDDGSDRLRGRLVSRSDRNGNAISIAYDYSATASTATLGGNRIRLWQIDHVTDAYGHQAIYHYRPTFVAGRPVVESIDLPNGAAITYTYNQPSLGFASLDLVGFSGAVLPTNEVVTVSATIDGGLVRLNIQDPGAEGTHRRKSVWLTPPTDVDPRSGRAAPYRVRQVQWANGETTYRCRLEALGSVWQTVVNEGARLFRIQHTAKGRVKQIDRAVAWNWANATSTYTWETTGTYQWDTKIRPTQWTTTTGKTLLVTPDPVTNATTRVDHANGTYSTATRNAFAQPLARRDRTDRKETSIYDGSGNRTSHRVGVDTPEDSEELWTYNSKGQVETHTDADGAVTTSTYFPQGYLQTVTEPTDHVAGSPADDGTPAAVWTYAYDGSGRRISMLDPRASLPIASRLTQYGWDGRNRLTSITYPDGSTDTTTYGTGVDANLVVRTKDRNGRITRYDYDAAGRRTTSTLYANQQAFDAGQGEILEFMTYVPGTTLPLAVWRLGERTDYGYDQQGRQTSVTVWPTGTTSLTTSMAYNAAGQQWLVTDAFGRRTIRLYDDEDRVTRTIQELVVGGLSTPLPATSVLATMGRITTANPPYVITDTTYDDEGRQLTSTDGRGYRTDITYDGRGQVKTVTEGANVSPATATEPATTTYGYDDDGRQITVRSPRQVTTATSYTRRGLTWTVTEAAGSADEAVVQTNRYSETRKLRFSTDANDHVLENRYGGCCDRLRYVLDQQGFMTEFTYDNVGNRTVTLDPNALTNTAFYDARNRVWKVTNAESESVVTTYDDNLLDGVGIEQAFASVAAVIPTLDLVAGMSDGAAVATTNALQQTTIEIMDGLGRRVRHIDPRGQVTRFTYDVVVTDSYQAVTQTLIATTVTDPLAHVTAQWLDGRGQPRVIVDGEAKRTRRGYDPSGNQVAERDPLGVGWDAVYSPRGFLLSRTDTRTAGPVTTSWTYDADGNRLTETVVIDGVVKTEIYTYDLRNRRETITDRLNGLTQFQYDDVGNLKRIIDAEGGITDYIYDERNLLKEEYFPGTTGGKRSYTYDPGRRLKTRTQQGN
jgi:YD repeat-containing protein